MKLSDIIKESKLSGELHRARNLFIDRYKRLLGGKSRELRLDFIEDILDETMTKAEIKFLILRLQKAYQKKK